MNAILLSETQSVGHWNDSAQSHLNYSSSGLRDSTEACYRKTGLRHSRLNCFQSTKPIYKAEGPSHQVRC